MFGGPTYLSFDYLSLVILPCTCVGSIHTTTTGRALASHLASCSLSQRESKIRHYVTIEERFVTICLV